MTEAAPSLRIGVWPGSSRDGNAFAELFAAGLRDAGAHIVDFEAVQGANPGALDVFHIHWPEQVFWAGGGARSILVRLVATLRTLHRLRRRGVVLVWMVHNLEPHDMSWKRRLLWAGYSRRLCALVDGFMTLSPATIDIVRQGLPGLAAKPADYAWHPAYPRMAGGEPPAELRGRLGFGVAHRVYAFLGMLRPYKGVEQLIDVFRGMEERTSRLLIAGEPVDKAYARSLQQRIGADRRIVLLSGHCSERAFSDYCAAADVIVLPMREYLHSGSVMRAVSEGRPLVTRDTPFAQAVSREVGEGWITTYTGELDAEVLRRCHMPQDPPRLQSFAVEAVGQRACAFYRKLIRLRSP